MTKLSPSSINLFIQDPALWILKHFYKQRSPTNIYAERGKAVEEGINYKFRNPDDLKTPGLIATDEFIAASFNFTEPTTDVLPLINNWADEGYKLLAEYSNNEKYEMQEEINSTLKGLSIYGFIDYRIDDQIIDLKTVNKLPHILTTGKRKGLLPAFKAGNVRQQLIYEDAMKCQAHLLFLSPDGHLWYEIQQQDRDEQWAVIEDTIEKIKECLTKGKEWSIMNYRPKNMYGIYWSPNLIEKANEIW